MNAHYQAHQAYAAMAAPTRTPRSAEYEAVARATQKLQAAQSLGAKGFPALVEAIHLNRKLWRIFAIDVADKGNKLPEDLKARILYLADFTHQQSSKVLSRRAPVSALIDVNLSILRGLRGKGAAK